MICIYCKSEMKIEIISHKCDFYGYLEGKSENGEVRYKCPNCSAEYCKGWLNSDNMALATLEQIHHIKQLFKELKISSREFAAYEFEKYVYMEDFKNVKITKEKAAKTIKFLLKFKCFEDWNSRIEKYKDENISSKYLKSFIPSNRELLLNMLDNCVYEI